MTVAKSPLPWSQKDETRPIFDADGNVVSFTLNGPRIVAAMNLLHEIAAPELMGDEPLNPEWVIEQARKIMGQQ